MAAGLSATDRREAWLSVASCPECKGKDLTRHHDRSTDRFVVACRTIPAKKLCAVLTRDDGRINSSSGARQEADALLCRWRAEF